MKLKNTLITSVITCSFLFISMVQGQEKIVLENSRVKYLISVDKGVHLSQIIHKETGTDFLADSPDLLFLSFRIPRFLDDVGFQLFTVEEDQGLNTTSVKITQQSTYVENPFFITQEFSLGEGDELQWKIRVINTATGGRAFHTPQNRAGRITFPVFQNLQIGNPSGMHYLMPTPNGHFCIDRPDDGIFYFTREGPMMPIDIYNREANLGIYFQILDTPLEFEFSDKDQLQDKVFSVTQKPGDTLELLDCRIGPHLGDWHAAFHAFKKYVRSNFDFTYYERPVQNAYRQRFVSHFTFLYGLDIYDPENNRFRINEFLDEGELNFGGYDYMLLWHDYPRMGLDDRDQFDMYEDLPGGLEGVREMVEMAHARDVQVFMPYKPWDIMKGRDDPFRQEARIARAINADGIFLDTMEESDSTFRNALDEVNRDIVFVSEGRPGLTAAQLVTGSWNQSGDATNKMPNVDLFRFIIPEHNVHNINRWARRRDELVYNALFNGTGIIVWEDIFGEINRFSWNERILISRYNRIIHENRDAYLTDHPVPLVGSLRPDLYINAFPNAEKCVYPSYQVGRENVNRSFGNRLIGPFMEITHPENWHFVDVWNHAAIPDTMIRGRRYLVFPEEPADVMSCIIGMPQKLKVNRQDQKLKIMVEDPADDASIHIHTVNNLTLMEEEVLVMDGRGGEVDVSEINLKFPYKVLVKLMHGEILKDEVIMDLGWKRF